MTGLLQFIWPPVREDDIQRSARERMLVVMAMTVATLGGFAGVLNFLENVDIYPIQSFAGVIVPFSAIAIPALARHARDTRLPGTVLTAILYLLVVGMIGTIGGMAHPAAIYLVGLPLPAAFLIGHRAGLAVSGLTALTMVGLFLARDIIPNPFADDIDMSQIGWVTTVLVVLTLGIGIAASAFQRELENVALALEEARQRADAASRSKSDFLASISHEIRTPMNGILGMAQALQDGDLPDRHKRQAETLSQSGTLLLRLVNDVLDLSKIEAGKLDIEARTFRMADTVDTLDALYRPVAEDKGIAFDISVSSGAGETLIGDPVRIGQILNNLVSNAIKFTQVGSVNIAIDCVEDPSDTSRREVILSVRDTGIGISDAVAARLFQPFAQADATTARTYGGSGLGLVICRHLCEMMDGDIRVDSAPGCGATFTARLHLAAAKSATRRTGIAPTAETGTGDAGSSLAGMRVLAADDNLTNRLVLQALLGDIVGELVLVENGQEALDALDGSHFDIVLLDSHMPVLDGVATAAAIRERERAQGLAPLPIYAVTADVMAHQAGRCAAAGMTGFIAKPVSQESLIEALARHAESAPVEAACAASA
mgnify:CR=1 FL=1